VFLKVVLNLKNSADNYNIKMANYKVEVRLKNSADNYNIKMANYKVEVRLIEMLLFLFEV